MKFDIEIDGIKLKVYKIEIEPRKDRATIVFLHDSLGCISLWRDFPETLAKITECDVLVYDRQGYGESAPFSFLKRSKNYLHIEAEILIKILDSLNISKPILFGHSDGASIALIAAAKYPDRIKGVISEGAHVFIEDISLAGIREAANTCLENDLIKRLAKYHGENAQNVFDIWINTWLNPEFHDWNIEELLPYIVCPTLVIQGENDEFGSDKQVDTIANLINGRAIKFIVPDTGHTAHKEASELVLAEAAKFILEIKLFANI